MSQEINAQALPREIYLWLTRDNVDLRDSMLSFLKVMQNYHYESKVIWSAAWVSDQVSGARRRHYTNLNITFRWRTSGS